MRTIAIVTERRADYSRYKPILELIREDPELDYKLIVTGISLLKEHGNDIDVIRRDGFAIEAVLPMFAENAPDTGAEMVRAMGRVMPALADLFERLRPDVILLDLSLPKLNGCDAALRIREQSWGKDILLIALTGWAKDEDKRRTKAAGFDLHLVKPIDLAVLEKIVADIQPTAV